MPWVLCAGRLALRSACRFLPQNPDVITVSIPAAHASWMLPWRGAGTIALLLSNATCQRMPGGGEGACLVLESDGAFIHEKAVVRMGAKFTKKNKTFRRVFGLLGGCV